MSKRIRILGLIMVFGALLGLANACQAESESESMFHSGQYVESDLDRTLASRRADALTNLEVEGGSVLVALAGVALALIR